MLEILECLQVSSGLDSTVSEFRECLDLFEVLEFLRLLSPRSACVLELLNLLYSSGSLVFEFIKSLKTVSSTACIQLKVAGTFLVYPI